MGARQERSSESGSLGAVGRAKEGLAIEFFTALLS